MEERSSLPDRADAVVVGGGMVGLRTALNLHDLGLQTVVVLERDTVGSGSSAKGAGGIRRQFGSRIEIEMSLASWSYHERMLADEDYEGGFEQVGYAFVAGAAEIGRLEAAWRVQSEMGLDVAWLERNKIDDLLPYCDRDGLVGGTLCAQDGFLKARKVVDWLMRRCKKAGVIISERSLVDAIEVERGRVRAVASRRHRIETEVVINAAGAWAGRVGELTRANLPVDPSPRLKLITDPLPEASQDTPLVMDLSTGAYVRYRQNRAIIGVKPARRVIGFEQITPDASTLSSMIERASIRFPGLRVAEVGTTVSGLYELTPDGLPLVGPVEDVAGFYVVAGFNGHGLMHSPAATRALAEYIVRGRPTTLDITPLSPGRTGVRSASAVARLV